jgi:predicted NAD/FAD-dependent oxidoreductase
LNTSRVWTALALPGLLALACGATIDRSPFSADDVARSPDPKIAIVGAGASGLVAARTLDRLGYTKVTVFERNDRVGGKVHTYAGDPRGVELGAYYMAPQDGDGVVLSLADELGVRYVRDSQPKFIVGADGVARSFHEFLLHYYSREEIAAATKNYAEVLESFAPNRSHYTDLHPDLTLPFDAFAEKYEFTPIARVAQAWMLAVGYAYYANVPAVYFMKIIETLVPLGADGVEEPRYLVFPRPEGFEALWKAVAAPLDVRLSSEVTKIVRARAAGPGSIRLTINGEQQLHFDRVIISAPLQVVADFLDVTDEERDLFGRIRSNRFFVTFFTAPGLTSRNAWFFDANVTPDRINHVGGWGDTWMRREVSPNWVAPVFVAYQVADWNATTEVVNRTLRSDVAAAGGFVAKVLAQAEWSYFPYVMADDLAAGFYDRVEALQGQRGTYYVGSTLSFETVEQSARYAQDLVTTHFPNRNP